MNKLQKVKEALEFYSDSEKYEPMLECVSSCVDKDGGYLAKEALVELKKFTEEGSWQPIETAPKDGGFILAYFPEGIGIEKVYFEEEAGQFETLRSEFNVKPTHWMPLSEPPKQVEK